MKHWKFTTGDRPNTVTAYERDPGGVLYLRIWDPTIEACRRRSLGHRDKRRAKTEALREAANLTEGASNLAQGKVTLAQVLALYLEHQSPRKKTQTEQRADERRAAMWTHHLGGRIDPHSISTRMWRAFVDRRRSGEIDAKGQPVAEPKPLGARTVEADCKWLRWVFNWASTWRTDHGYLMRENPIRGFELPREDNPRRPVASHDRVEAIREVSSEVGEYFGDLFDLVVETGRRISAVCSLRHSDLRLNDGTPNGSIVWPAQTDKMGRETRAPISATAREAVDRILASRPGIGDAYLFPSATNGAKPISRYVARDWLRQAETLAELKPLKGSLWHAYRRKWATERKHLPDVDVAAAGGWKTVETMKMSYQHADLTTMINVVNEPRRIREAQ